MLHINLKGCSLIGILFSYDRSAGDAHSSAAPDPAFAFVGGPCCPTLEFVIAFWIMITFYTLLPSLFCILALYQITERKFPKAPLYSLADSLFSQWTFPILPQKHSKR